MRRLRPTSISETDLANVEIWRGIYLQVLSWRQSRPRYSARLSRLRFEQAAASGRGGNRTARRPSINSTASRPWRVVSLRAFRLGETEIHETLPVAFVGPSRHDRAISPSRSPGSERVKARCSEPCAGYSCARGSVVAPACRGRHWQV